MSQDQGLPSLRAQVTALVAEEAALLNEAFALSRDGGERHRVDALFAKVQAIQVERQRLKQEIGKRIGSQRLHMAAEVWKPGAYEYRETPADAPSLVRVSKGTLGFEVHMHGRAVPIESLKGSFDGPMASDAAVAGESPGASGYEAAMPQLGSLAVRRGQQRRKKAP